MLWGVFLLEEAIEPVQHSPLIFRFYLNFLLLIYIVGNL